MRTTRLTTRPTALFGLCFLAAACANLTGTAPPRREVIQAQLQAIGRSKPLDITKILEQIDPVITKPGTLDVNALKQTLRAALPQTVSFGFEQLWRGISAQVGQTGSNDADDRVRFRMAIVEQLVTTDEDNRLYAEARGHNRTVKPHSSTEPSKQGSGTEKPKDAQAEKPPPDKPPAEKPQAEKPPAEKPPTEKPKEGEAGMVQAAEEKDEKVDAADRLDQKAARDALISKYIIRIQDYHEANYEDVFKNTALIGFDLDAGTTIAAALATAFTPVSTKTAFAAVATICSGLRLAASKNVLNEKTSAAVLNVMIAQRTQGLATLTNGMKEPVSRYSVDTALVDLATYFNSGGLDKAIAQMEAETSKAKENADAQLSQAKSQGVFTATTTAPGGKGTLELTFDPKDSPGVMHVTEVTWNGEAVSSTAYTTKGFDEGKKPFQVVFGADQFPPATQIVVVTGTCAAPVTHPIKAAWQ